MKRSRFDEELHNLSMAGFCERLLDATFKTFPQGVPAKLVINVSLSDCDPGSTVYGACATLYGKTVRVPWELGPGKYGIDFRETANELREAFVAAGIRLADPSLKK